MNPVFSDALQQLRDVHAPATPGWWPPAPGWWLLAGLALVLTAVLLLRALRRRRRRAIYVAALVELQRIAAAADLSQSTDVQAAQAIASLLRRLALAAGHAAAALPVEVLPMILFGRELPTLNAALAQRFAAPPAVDDCQHTPTSQPWDVLQHELERAARR